MRGVIVGLAIMLPIYAAAFVVAKGHAARGSLGISFGAR